VATWLVRRWIGATCRGRPCRHPPCHRSNIVTAATVSRAREECRLKLVIRSSPRPRGPTGGPSPRGARWSGRL
jgi:hypothetical protein